jgi:hypothetical protein
MRADQEGSLDLSRRQTVACFDLIVPTIGELAGTDIFTVFLWDSVFRLNFFGLGLLHNFVLCQVEVNEKRGYNSSHYS